MITLLDIPISYIVLKSGYPPYTVMYISILTELIALIARIWILNALIPMHISNFIIEVIGRSLLVFILAAIIPTGLSQYIPDTFTWIYTYMYYYCKFNHHRTIDSRTKDG